MNVRPGLIDGRLAPAPPNKGRLAEPAIALLREAGYQFEADDRRLFAPCENYPLDLLFVRAEDIPEYTGDGVVDLGITGSNLVEELGSPVTQGMALGFGHCRLRVAVPDERPFQQLGDLAGRAAGTPPPRSPPPVLQGSARGRRADRDQWRGRDHAPAWRGRCHRRPGLDRQHAGGQRPAP